MNKSSVLSHIEENKLVAVTRVDNIGQIEPVVDAIIAGGVNVIELTMTIPGVLDSIQKLQNNYGHDITIGMGSVLDAKMAGDVIQAGAAFVVSPILKKGIIEQCQKYDVAVSAGTYTPTEIQTAWEWGSDIVKVFPAGGLGASYIKGVLAPMPHLKLMPTGGVDAGNVDEWLDAGCVALGIGSALVDIRAVRGGNYAKITKNAKALVRAVKSWKESNLVTDLRSS